MARLINSVSAVGTDSLVTTAGIDTNGATLIVVHVGLDNSGTPTISDSLGNTYTALTAINSGAAKSILYYKYLPLTGSAHTFTNSGAFNFSTIEVVAFGATKITADPFDQENGGTGLASTTCVLGSITPSENNEVLVTGICLNGAGLPVSIDSGFTVLQDEEFGAGNNYGSAIAYRILETAAAIAPTWTRTNANSSAARIASFRSAPNETNSNLLLMNVG